VTDCPKPSDLAEKRVKFVTFNYDMSLERRLYRGLRAIRYFSSSDIENFLAPERFFHVYGRLTDDFTTDLELDLFLEDFMHAQPGSPPWENCIAALDHAYKACQGLNVIDPQAKGNNLNEIEAAATAISKAKVVYILGYGFDKNNNERLKLDTSLFLNVTHKCVMFTNFKNSERINKAASRLFFHNLRNFGAGQPVVVENPGSFYCEKSIRDVYEALELDFDSLEDQFGSAHM
jgi:hypothetical protein